MERAWDREAEPAVPRERRLWRNVLRALGLVLGAALLLGAAVYAGRGVDWSVLTGAPPWLGTLLGAAVGANLVLTSLLFWAITRSFDAEPSVSVGRMTALISVSSLLNYLPLLRPGLLGRASYLKLRHGLPLRQSVVILLIVLVLAVVVLLAIAVALVLFEGPWRWVAAGGLVVGLSAIAGPVGRRVLRRPVERGWLWVVLRAADVLVAGLRLWVAFWILGASVGYAEAVVAGAAALLVRLAGITPNGLGLSEWTVAVLTPVLAPVEMAVGAAAALVDRAVEVLVVSASAAWGGWTLRR